MILSWRRRQKKKKGKTGPRDSNRRATLHPLNKSRKFKISDNKDKANFVFASENQLIRFAMAVEMGMLNMAPQMVSKERKYIICIIVPLIFFLKSEL